MLTIINISYAYHYYCDYEYIHYYTITTNH
jgi:hypothetical protein